FSIPSDPNRVESYAPLSNNVSVSAFQIRTQNRGCALTRAYACRQDQPSSGAKEESARQSDNTGAVPPLRASRDRRGSRPGQRTLFPTSIRPGKEFLRLLSGKNRSAALLTGLILSGSLLLTSAVAGPPKARSRPRKAETPRWSPPVRRSTMPTAAPTAIPSPEKAARSAPN